MSKPEEKSSCEKVPLWYISFADMITLLLSFFVMLQTMAKTQDAKLLGISQQSFRRAIDGLGIPDFLYGKQNQLSLEYRKLKYPTEEADTPSEPFRIIDADDNRIRQLFDEIRKEMQTSSSDTKEKVLTVVSLPVNFELGSSTLDEPARNALDSLAQNLMQSSNSQSRHVTVVSWAPQEPTRRAQWMVSAQRAKEVENHLSGALAGSRKDQWRFSSWGTPPGKRNAAAAQSSTSEVVIAVMATGE